MAQEAVRVEPERLQPSPDQTHLRARALAEEVVHLTAVRVGVARDVVERMDGVGRELDGAEALGPRHLAVGERTIVGLHLEPVVLT